MIDGSFPQVIERAVRWIWTCAENLIQFVKNKANKLQIGISCNKSACPLDKLTQECQLLL